MAWDRQLVGRSLRSTVARRRGRTTSQTALPASQRTMLTVALVVCTSVMLFSETNYGTRHRQLPHGVPFRSPSCASEIVAKITHKQSGRPRPARLHKSRL